MTTRYPAMQWPPDDGERKGEGARAKPLNLYACDHQSYFHDRWPDPPKLMVFRVWHFDCTLNHKQSCIVIQFTSQQSPRCESDMDWSQTKVNELPSSIKKTLLKTQTSTVLFAQTQPFVCHKIDARQKSLSPSVPSGSKNWPCMLGLTASSPKFDSGIFTCGELDLLCNKVC